MLSHSCICQGVSNEPFMKEPDVYSYMMNVGVTRRWVEPRSTCS